MSRRLFLSRTALGATGLASVGGLSSLLAACGSSSKSTATTEAAATTVAASETTAAASSSVAAATGKLIMQSAWVNDAEFIGYFIAQESGIYQKAGIDFTYLSGGPNVIPEETLTAGKADISLTTPDTTIKAIVDNGAKFKIIGAQYQKNPLGVVSLKASNINSPADLVGKTLAVPDVNRLSVSAMFKLNNIDESKVKIVPYEYDPTPLLKGEVDATVDFTDDVPFTISQSGKEANSFLLYDFGFKIYNDTVVVTEDTLKNKRELLVAWLRASREAWDENFKDPAVYPPKFADSFFKGNGRTIDNEVFLNKASQPLVSTPKGIFAMTDEDIAANVKSLNDIGIKATADMFDTSLLAEI
jgi:ABC-type nitrate/sulfonate/bicarbonate transport system substrate-binding protein